MFLNQMHLVLEKCRISKQELPIYCIIVDEKNCIIGESANQVETDKNPCLHAEIIAIQQALKNKNNDNKYLENCSLYVNLEPCIMCGYAISLARIKNVFFGAENKKFGFFSQKIPSIYKVNYFQIMQNECEEMLNKFFIQKRKK